MKTNKKIKIQNNPLVSVVIPIFNGSEFLEETVMSVMKSIYKNFEVILVDDGSTDKSEEICHKLEKRYKKVRFYSFPKNKGLGRVLNFALKKAKGKYICRINQDDVMLPYRIKVEVDYLNKHPEIVALGSWIELFNSKSESTIIKFLKNDSDIRKAWHLVSPFSDPTVMYRKKIAIKAGGYLQEFWPADDTQLWLRMARIGKLANIQKILVRVRFHKKAGSVYYFRKLALSTYKMHRWAHGSLERANLLIQSYWLIQLLAGLVLSAEFNWKVYRLIKKSINAYLSFTFFLTKTLAKIGKAIREMIHPKKLNLSGSYNR